MSSNSSIAAALFTDNTIELHPTTVSRGLLVGGATAGSARHVLGADGSKIQRLATNVAALTITSTARTTANGIELIESDSDLTSAILLKIAETANALTAARTGSQVAFTSARDVDGSVVSDNFDNLLIQRTSIEDSGTYTVTGSLLKLENIVDANVADTTHLLELDQDTDSSGTFINFAGTVGVGNPIEAVGAKTLTVTHFLKVQVTGGLTRYIEVGTIA